LRARGRTTCVAITKGAVSLLDSIALLCHGVEATLPDLCAQEAAGRRTHGAIEACVDGRDLRQEGGSFACTVAYPSHLVIIQRVVSRIARHKRLVATPWGRSSRGVCTTVVCV
jgi:hypothetical protein